MNNPDDIRESVSKTYARAVEQTPAAKRSCCAGTAPQGFVATLAGPGKVASIRVVGCRPEEVLP